MLLRSDKLTLRRNEAINRAAARSGVPLAHVEKDFWLTEVLRGVVRVADGHGLSVVLKGGTSLSKAFGLIERFSEDVDVLVNLSGMSGNQRKAALKSFRDGVAAHVGLVGEVDETKTVWESKISVHYPYSAEEDAALAGLRREGVLLEIGAWGGALPNQKRSLRSVVAEHAGSDVAGCEEMEPVPVRVLAPERTAVEKLMILHAAADEQRRSVTARHYYDLHRLLSDEAVAGALSDGGAALLAREIHVHSTVLGVPSIERPISGLHTSHAFDAQNPDLKPARSAYDDVLTTLLWPTAAVRPSFDECCDVIRSATYL